MIKNSKIIRFISCFLLVTFVYTSVLFEPLYGIVSIAKDRTLMIDMKAKLQKSILPASIGRIANGEYVTDNSLIIYIQDLHCHSEVQKNIAQVIKYFDDNYGVDRIFVEGAPKGKVNTAALSGIHQDVKAALLDNLINAGKLSGAEYYAAKNSIDKLYGIEDWNVYHENLSRIKKLIREKDINSKIVSGLTEKINRKKKKFASKKLKKLEKQLNKKYKSSEKKYRKLNKIAEKHGIHVYEYPNLYRHFRLMQLKKQVNYNKLSAELKSYMQEIKRIVPFSVYSALSEKLKDNNNKIEEFYFGLSEIARVYAPQLALKYKNISGFFESIRLNYYINPIELIVEEKKLVRSLKADSAEYLLDKELVFLGDMTEILKDIVKIGVVPENYKYFNENLL